MRARGLACLPAWVSIPAVARAARRRLRLQAPFVFDVARGALSYTCADRDRARVPPASKTRRRRQARAFSSGARARALQDTSKLGTESAASCRRSGGLRIVVGSASIAEGRTRASEHQRKTGREALCELLHLPESLSEC